MEAVKSNSKLITKKRMTDVLFGFTLFFLMFVLTEIGVGAGIGRDYQDLQLNDEKIVTIIRKEFVISMATALTLAAVNQVYLLKESPARKEDSQ